jgi:hydrogenase/urease accessory protein HupE
MSVLALRLLILVPAAWLTAAIWAEPVQAHPLAPALLELRETGPARYSVLWRTSAQRIQIEDVTPILPRKCLPLAPEPVAEREKSSVALRWTVQCAGGLYGERIAFAGIERSRINVILRIEALNGDASQTLLDARQPEYLVPAAGNAAPVFTKYLNLGAGHLLTGFDHLLFVAGLLLLIPGWRRLLITVTAFTLGHSFTLALAALGYVQVNAALTELGIALSILVLACELARPAAQSYFRRKPWNMAAAFGLLHGLGFAGALSEAGLPQAEIPLALLAFNLGIEAGQVAVIVLLLACAHGFRRVLESVRAPQFAAGLLPVYLIGSLAACWCFERASVLLT